MTESPQNLQAFFDRIVHGKVEHRAWLKKEFEEFWKIKVEETLTLECGTCRGTGTEPKSCSMNHKHEVECTHCDGEGRLKL